MSEGATKSWLAVAGPYVAALVSVAIALGASLYGGRADAETRLTKLEQHSSDQDKRLDEQLKDIKDNLAKLSEKLDHLKK